MGLLGETDYRAVRWGPTLALNTLRAFSAGLVWGVLVLFASGGSLESGWWAIPFVLPAGYVMWLPVYFLSCKIVTTFAGDVGQLGVNVMTFFLALAIAVGDPGIYFLHKKKPNLVPTDTFKPINMTLFLFVVDPDRV